MSLTEHLEELRKVVIRMVVIVFASFVVCYSVGDYISEILLQPLRDSMLNLGEGQIVYIGLLDKVWSQLQVAFWSSIIVSSPLWFVEVWRFVKPGLYSHEVKAVRPFLVVGFLLFVIGVSFGYFIVFPLTFETLMLWGVGDVQAMINLKDYLILAIKVLVLLGLLFQVPNIMLILGFMGLVTKQSLRSWRRYVIVILAIASALLTPPDPMTMLALLVPMMALYELGILAVALVVHPYLHKQHMGEESEEELPTASEEYEKED